MVYDYVRMLTKSEMLSLELQSKWHLAEEDWPYISWYWKMAKQLQKSCGVRQTE